MKILKSKSISSFGGLNFIFKELDENGIDRILDQTLSKLPVQAKYSWKDLMYSFWSIYFCGGDCIEDLSVHMKQALHKNPYVKLPSPDRVLERMKELSEPLGLFMGQRGVAIHEFSMNDKINSLNIKILKRLRLLKSKGNILDYDNTYIFSEKSDAIMTHKHQRGYCPGVGIIGNNIVYLENRNGNSGAHILQQDTLSRMFGLLRSNKINVKVFRADSASYSLAALDVINRNVEKFYIKTRIREALNELVNQVEKWEKTETGGRTLYRGSIQYCPFQDAIRRLKKQVFDKPFRLVITKEKRNDGQINMFTGEAYNYQAIITNDFEMTDDEVVFFYNQRGKIERQFDILKNDFGWNNMPFSKLIYNTVFLLFTSICRNIYDFIINKFSKLYKGLSSNFRIKKFIFRFICIPGKWVNTGGAYRLRLYGNIYFKT